jgi:hypothetical protein
MCLGIKFGISFRHGIIHFLKKRSKSLHPIVHLFAQGRHTLSGPAYGAPRSPPHLGGRRTGGGAGVCSIYRRIPSSSLKSGTAGRGLPARVGGTGPRRRYNREGCLAILEEVGEERGIIKSQTWRIRKRSTWRRDVLYILEYKSLMLFWGEMWKREKKKER